MSSAAPQATWYRRLSLDPYIGALLGVVVLASLLPLRGEPAQAFGIATKLAIGLLFFFHGAKLPREAVLAGLTQWRLHLAVITATFVLFPLIGLAMRGLPPTLLPTALAPGVLFLCLLPSTVQSSIAFTSIARGNVAAAVVAASLSNLLGIVLTPVLAALTLRTHGTGGASADQMIAVVVQLLLPFAAGQVARPFLKAWMTRHSRLISLTDRSSIIMVVYGAFSAAVVDGLWHRVSPIEILQLIIICGILLALILVITAMVARALGFSKADEIVLVFCGSKKSLASGAPMASILFPPANVGLLVLPLMIFHQLQLMVCALLAQRYALRPRA